MFEFVGGRISARVAKVFLIWLFLFVIILPLLANYKVVLNNGKIIEAKSKPVSMEGQFIFEGIDDQFYNLPISGINMSATDVANQPNQSSPQTPSVSEPPKEPDQIKPTAVVASEAGKQPDIAGQHRQAATTEPPIQSEQHTLTPPLVPNFSHVQGNTQPTNKHDTILPTQDSRQMQNGGFAQSQSTAIPRKSSIVRWEEGSQGSDKFINDGAVIKVLSADGVTVAASLRDTGWKMRADIMIINKTEHRFDIVPENFTLYVVAPKSKSLAYQAPDKLAKAIDRGARWSAALSGLAAATATQQSTSTSSTQGSVNATDDYGYRSSGTYSGSTTTTTTSPDYAARQRANEQARRAAEDAGNQIGYIDTISLKPNTVMPGQDVFGAVYFEREKKKDITVLRIPVGPTILEFPFFWIKKK